MNIYRFAWRESRGSRSKLFLMSAAILFGVAALVAVSSFIANLRDALELNAKTLLGADLLIRSSRPFNAADEEFITRVTGSARSAEEAREISFSSMAVAPASGQSRLAQIRALSGAFPFYGKLETDPPEAANQYRANGSALVDKTLLLQLGIERGATIRIGEADFRVIGTLERIPGDSSLWESIAPRIFISYDAVGGTNLLQRGSRVTYKVYVKAPDLTAEKVSQSFEEEAKRLRLGLDTAADRKRAIEEVANNIHWYLRLSSFFALVLGGLGVASGVRQYLRQKASIVALLRCLGAKKEVALRIFLLQVAAAAFAASVLGAFIGAAAQYVLPHVFRAILPAEVTLSISWLSLGLGISLGTAVAVLICLDSLSGLRNVRPMTVLRGEMPGETKAAFFRRALIACFLFCFSYSQARDGIQATWFFLFTVVSLLLLAAASKVLMHGARKAAASGPYVLRQGLLNLSRPGNQTATLTVVIGFTVLFVATVSFLRVMLVEQIRLSAAGDRPNLLLFDIQPDQLAGVKKLLTEREAPILETAPVVSMRILSINGRDTRELLHEPKSTIPEWTLQREYRSTYRDTLWDSEELVGGNFVPRFDSTGDVPVSLEEGIAEKLGVKIGSKIVFDVQGLEIPTVVASLRKVAWQQLHANFFMVFPTGVLESAPQFFIIATRAEPEAAAAALQRESVAEFPNVSLLNLTTVTKIVDDVLAKFTVAVQVIGVCLVAVSLTLLATAVRSGVAARIREQSLLKVLGARRRQIVVMLCSEYLFLGLAGAVSGGILACGASWIIGRFVFHARFAWQAGALALPVFLAPVTVLLIGAAASAEAFRHKPLDVMRNE